MPFLKFQIPGKSAETHVLSGTRITVGRHPDNTIQILDRSVSARHAEFIAVDGHYRLHDRESTNLSCVDGQPVSVFHVHRNCQIQFGAVVCEFDAAPSPEPEAPTHSAKRMEHEVAFLRGENAELLGKIRALERRIEILGSAQILGEKPGSSTSLAAAEALKAATAERDRLHRENEALQAHLNFAREELAIATRERDAAREAAELMRNEKVTLVRELQTPVAISRATGALAHTSAAVQRVRIALPPPFDQLAGTLGDISLAVERLATHPADPDASRVLHLHARTFAERAETVKHHAVARLGTALEALARHIAAAPDAADPSTIRTLAKSVELLARTIEPRGIESGAGLAQPSVLVVDDDADLRATIAATLDAARIQVTGCADGTNALRLLRERKFDLVLLDAGLPDIDGPAVCVLARDLPAHGKTPIVFITVTNTADKRAEASLSGGNDFLRKPFSVAELTLKAQLWTARNQLGLL